MPSLRVAQHFPSASPGFAPKLTMMLTVAEKSCLSSHSILHRVLTNLLEHGCAIDQHDTGVQILVKVSVALHDVLKKKRRGFHWLLCRWSSAGTTIPRNGNVRTPYCNLKQCTRNCPSHPERSLQGLLVVFRARLLALLLFRLVASVATGCSLDMVTH